jgi:hypothetical protein
VRVGGYPPRARARRRDEALDRALLGRPAASPVERMDYTAALMALLALVAAADSAKPRPTPPQADAAVEIRSYGEAPADLRELLIPFVARLDFAESKRYSFTAGQHLESEFRRPDGDRVYMLGGSNCLVVGYFSTRHPAIPPELSPSDRANRFIAQLKDFLASLPTTRPIAYDTLWSWKSWCS